jgi:Hypervirulence associated proteins TUDOR domain
MRKGTQVTWKYGTGTATGKIESVHKEAVTRTIKGSEIHRNGSADDPALVIVQDNGNKVLKLQSEVTAAK